MIPYFFLLDYFFSVSNGCSCDHYDSDVRLRIGAYKWVCHAANGRVIMGESVMLVGYLFNGFKDSGVCKFFAANLIGCTL
eukprot:486330-Amorphochlora_amoeboformis.AAC.1